MKIYSNYSFEVHQSKQCINFDSVCFLFCFVLFCFVFLTHVYLLDPLKLSFRSKRALVSFILVFVPSTILSMISLSEYKWKVSSMFSILFSLEFWARQLILPKMVSHFHCLPVATGCSELHQIFFVFLFFF